MKIAAIILAAGQSQRFGMTNKLFASHQGVPVVDHCLNLVLSTAFYDRILVTGFENERINMHVNRLAVRPVLNPDYQSGLGSSLAMGAKALQPDCDAFMVFLADLPGISPELVSNLIETYENNQPGKSIIRPTHNGKSGHPVLFAISHAPNLQMLVGDQGAYEIIKKQKTSTLNVEVKSSAIVRDIDRSGDLQT